MNTGTPLDQYITREEWVRARGVSVRTIKRDEVLRRGPKPIKIGRKTYLFRADISAWLESLRNGGQNRP